MKKLLELTYASYVNLDHRADRRERMEQDLKRLGIVAERTRGMLLGEYAGDPMRIKAMWDRPQKGAIGCHFSQVSVMNEALKRRKHALVMEDDLVFCSDFQERLDDIQSFMDYRAWDIFWLGATFHVNPPYWHNSHARGCHSLGYDAKRVYGRFMRTYGCFCTYAYIVNLVSIAKILEMMKPLLSKSIGIDHMMIMLQPRLLTFSYVPGCVKQYDHLSDIGVDSNGRPAPTVFSGFAKLNGTYENSAYWWADKASDFDPDKFNWHEAS